MAEHEGLAHTFHEKVISLDTMQLRLLVPTAVAIALVVAGGVLVATRDLPWPSVSAGAVAGQVVGIAPLPIMVLAAIALVVAWTFILAGALHAHLAVRIIAVAAYALAQFQGAVSLEAAGATLPALFVFLVILSVVAATIGLYVTDRGNRHQAPHLHHRSALRLTTFGWILLATGLIYALLMFGGLRRGQLGWSITSQMIALQFLLAPMLVLAGTDFAEWAEVVSGRLASLAERLPRGALWGALAVAAAGVLAWAAVTQRGNPGLTWRALVVVALLALAVTAVAALSRRRPTSTRVPFWSLLIGALLLYCGVLAGVIIDAATTPAPANSPLPVVAATRQADPGYSLLVPQGWAQTTVPGGRMWSGSVDGRPARLALLWGTGDSGRAVAAALATPVALRPHGSDEGWSAFSALGTIAGGRAEGDVWVRTAAGRTWVLAGLRAGGATAASKALFDSVRESWSPDPSAGAVADASEQPPRGPLIAVGIAGAVMLALGLILLLRGAGEVATGGLFLALCGLFTMAGRLALGGAFLILGAGSDAQAAGMENLLIAAGVAAVPVLVLTAAVPAWRLPRPPLRLLLVLLLGFICLAALTQGFFGTAQSSSERFAVVAGVVLVAALLWDVLMSGESFTNTGGLAVPNHSRVLLYLGYTLMVVTAVLFLGAIRVQGGGSAGFSFDSEAFPSAGLSHLGPALLLTFFLVNLAAWQRGRRTGRPDGLDQVDRSVLDEVARTTAFSNLRAR